jgi:predicted DNA-binding protein (MmcQ/YjbR family)
MNIDSIRAFCLSLPHATENMQWDSLLFRVAGKIFAFVPLEPDSVMGRVVLKSTPERGAELLEIEGINRAPYFRHDWISLERFDVLRDDEIRELIRQSYDLVYAKLSKKARVALERSKPPRRARRAA